MSKLLATSTTPLSKFTQTVHTYRELPLLRLTQHTLKLVNLLTLGGANAIESRVVEPENFERFIYLINLNLETQTTLQSLRRTYPSSPHYYNDSFNAITHIIETPQYTLELSLQDTSQEISLKVRYPTPVTPNDEELLASYGFTLNIHTSPLAYPYRYATTTAYWLENSLTSNLKPFLLARYKPEKKTNPVYTALELYRIGTLLLRREVQPTSTKHGVTSSLFYLI